MTPFSIRFTARAGDDAVRLDTSIYERVKIAIKNKLSTDPYRFGKPLRYSLRHLRSLRVGDWRVLFAISGAVVVVYAILHRKEGYDDVA